MKNIIPVLVNIKQNFKLKRLTKFYIIIPEQLADLTNGFNAIDISRKERKVFGTWSSFVV